jgi:hypothetical protein
LEAKDKNEAIEERLAEGAADPYGIANIDLSTINRKQSKYPREQIGGARWLLDKGMPQSRVADLMNLPTCVIQDIRKDKALYTDIPAVFPVCLIEKEDIGIIEGKLKKLKAPRGSILI